MGSMLDVSSQPSSPQRLQLRVPCSPPSTRQVRNEVSVRSEVSRAISAPPRIANDKCRVTSSLQMTGAHLDIDSGTRRRQYRHSKQGLAPPKEKESARQEKASARVTDIDGVVTKKQLSGTLTPSRSKGILPLDSPRSSSNSPVKLSFDQEKEAVQISAIDMYVGRKHFPCPLSPSRSGAVLPTDSPRSASTSPRKVPFDQENGAVQVGNLEGINSKKHFGCIMSPSRSTKSILPVDSPNSTSLSPAKASPKHSQDNFMRCLTTSDERYMHNRILQAQQTSLRRAGL